jgi:hypothetical protein
MLRIEEEHSMIEMKLLVEAFVGVSLKEVQVMSLKKNQLNDGFDQGI